jgi:mannitol-specific phosphotransferase system IIBC component
LPGLSFRSRLQAGFATCGDGQRVALLVGFCSFVIGARPQTQRNNKKNKKKKKKTTKKKKKKKKLKKKKKKNQKQKKKNNKQLPSYNVT